MTIITREFSRVTGEDKIHVELNNHRLISKEAVDLDIGDVIKKGDIITEYTVDDGKPLLEKVYKKEWNVNHYPEIAKKKQILKETV